MQDADPHLCKIPMQSEPQAQQDPNILRTPVYSGPPATQGSWGTEDWGSAESAGTFLFPGSAGSPVPREPLCSAIPRPSLSPPTFEALPHAQCQPILGPLHDPRVVEHHAGQHNPLPSHHGLVLGLFHKPCLCRWGQRMGIGDNLGMCHTLPSALL